MSAEVETMFYLRKEPWHGLGTQVMEAPNSKEALKLAGLDWKVVQEPLITGAGDMVDGYKANVRNTDNQVLGVVGDRYRIVQNEEAFAFTDDLLGYGVRYETAGSLQGGKKVWMLAHMPQEYIIAGEHISPYLLFSNSHDGSGAVKVAITPIRVVCNNTLNLALNTAKRSWSAMHGLLPEDDLGMYAMTTENMVRGAVSVLSEEVLKTFSEEKKADYYLLPSSIYEWILIEKTDDLDPVYLRLMVIESNSDPDKVRLEELLSDQVYLYERKTGKVRIA